MRSVITGIKYHPWRALTYFGASFGVLWTLVEGLTYFLPSVDLSGTPMLLVVAVTSAIYATLAIRRPAKIEIPIRHTNTRIEVQFGDIFREDGLRVIPVNEFFDSELGLPVSKRSLHGILISRCFGGHSQAYLQSP